ncbi:hypothetical protein RE0356_47490 [Prescottella equi]|nr:hypothetical protein RE0356_47490 [Prescottella equi]
MTARGDEHKVLTGAGRRGRDGVAASLGPLPKLMTMSGQASARTRARDIDRAQTCGLLDAGYSEGQLTTSEYDTRTAAAMKAKTLGELDALVSDLQIPAHLSEAVVREAPGSRRKRRGPVIAAAVVAVAVVIGLVAVVTRGDDASPRTDPVREVVADERPAAAPAPAPIPGEPDAIVIEPVDTTTAEGIEEFLQQFQIKFGDQIVDELYLKQRYATFTRMLPEQPHRVQRWDYYRGFNPSGSPSSRPSDASVDLAGLRIEGLRNLIRDAPSTLGLPGGRVDNIIVRPNPITDEPEILVYVEDPGLFSGHLYATFDGVVTDVSAPSRAGG